MEKRFEGVRWLELIFLDEKLASIEITYDSSTRWGDSYEFAMSVAEALKLPTKGWRDRTTDAILSCSGFQIEAEASFNPKLIIQSIGLEAEIDRRQAEAEKARRKVFEP